MHGGGLGAAIVLVTQTGVEASTEAAVLLHLLALLEVATGLFGHLLLNLPLAVGGQLAGFLCLAGLLGSIVLGHHSVPLWVTVRTVEHVVPAAANGRKAELGRGLLPKDLESGLVLVTLDVLVDRVRVALRLAEVAAAHRRV